MKDALKRAAQLLGMAPAPAQAEVEPVVEALTAPVLDVATAADEALSELTGKFEAQGAELATALAELAEVKASLAEVTAALTEVSNAKEVAEADALATKLAARQVRVEAALGTEHSAGFMAVVADMSDDKFEGVMAAMTASSTKEAESPAFQEVGVDAQADAQALAKATETNGTMEILRAKYQKPATN